jgi:hypothetical protein
MDIVVFFIKLMRSNKTNMYTSIYTHIKKNSYPFCVSQKLLLLFFLARA